MAIPQAVLEQGEAAKKLQDELAQGIPVSIVKDDEAPVKPSSEDVLEKEVKKVEQPKVDVASSDEFKHKYDVLQGKYNSEMQGMRNELNSLKTNLQQANGTIANLNELLVQVGSKIPTDDDGGDTTVKSLPKTTLNAEDYEGYGDEMVDMVNRVNTLISENEALRSQVDNIGGEIQQVGETVRVESAGKFFDALTGLVPEWRSINKEDGWLNWLGDEDPGTGERRQDLLNRAHQEGNLNRVAHWFNSWITENGYKPGTTSRKAGRSLDGEIVPDETSGSTGPIDDGGSFKVVTREQFQKATKDKINRLITDEEFRKIQINFQRSISEGKVK